MSGLNDCARMENGAIFSVKKVERTLYTAPLELFKMLQGFEARIEKLEAKLNRKPKKEKKPKPEEEPVPYVSNGEF